MFKRVKATKESRTAQKDVGNYINKQRTLIFSTRGIVHRDRHLMTDLRDLLPHSRKDAKFDAKGMFATCYFFLVLPFPVHVSYSPYHSQLQMTCPR